MLYGYVSIASNQIKICKEQIKAIKEKYGYTDELKWIIIHDKTFQVYRRVGVLEPQTRNGESYYLLTAYYLNKEYGEKQMQKKLLSKLTEVL